MAGEHIEAQDETLSAIAEIRAARISGKFSRYFPDCRLECDPQSMRPEDHVGMCRMLYQKHLAFFASRERERLMIAANRIGKTQAGAYETTAHLTGLYPKWGPDGHLANRSRGGQRVIRQRRCVRSGNWNSLGP